MCENTNTVSLPEALLDPRLSLDFLSELWPLCNGKPAPLLAQANIYDTRCIEFLAAYYEVNIRNAELANAFGNLASRTISMIDRYRAGVVPAGNDASTGTLVMNASAARASAEISAARASELVICATESRRCESYK